MKGNHAPIGVFGGTFDPVHLGHLRPAFEVFEALGCAELRLIPAHVPPHRDTPSLNPTQRLVLLKRAVADTPGFKVDARELGRAGPSYMVDTLASLRGEHPDAPLCLILGMDSFSSLPSWERWRELADYAHLVVMDRPGERFAAEPEFAAWVDERREDDVAALQSSRQGRVYFQAVTQLDISATRIRKLLAAGRSVRFLVPDTVLGLIRDQGLYR